MKRISMAQCCNIFGISISTLLRQRKNDSSFPKSQKINKKEIFFLLEEILEWKERNRLQTINFKKGEIK